MRITRLLCIVSILVLLSSTAACRLAYVLHLAAGQARLLQEAVPVTQALREPSLSPEQKERLLLVAQVKSFGEKVLGLKQTRNYQTVYLESPQSPIYVVSASPKDRLTRVTWWFPIVGRMPYLGFFEEARARAEKQRLMEKDLDVIMGVADAYSTLGWFRDPLTLNLLDGSLLDLVETILHEMTHTTLYIKGQGEFNEGLATLVGKVGAFQFLQKTYGPPNPLTMEAKGALADERVFSSFLSSLLQELEGLYASPLSYQEKLAQREKVFARARRAFARLKPRFQTDRFVHFGQGGLNNAYLLSLALYHRHFHLFEAVLKGKGDSIRETLRYLRELSKEGGNMLAKMHG